MNLSIYIYFILLSSLVCILFVKSVVLFITCFCLVVITLHFYVCTCTKHT